MFVQFHVHERVGGMKIQFEVREDLDHVGFELAIVIVGGRELDGFLPDVGLGDFEGPRVFVHAEDVAEENLGDEDAVIVKIVPAAEGEGGFDVGRQFGEVEFAVIGLEDF